MIYIACVLQHVFGYHQRRTEREREREEKEDSSMIYEMYGPVICRLRPYYRNEYCDRKTNFIIY